MNCEEIRDDLEAYVFGDLGADRARVVADHLESCPTCGAAYERTRSLIGDLKELGESFAPLERYEVPSAAPRRSPALWGWRLTAAVALIFAGLSVAALAVPAIAQQLPVPVARELDRLESENERLASEVASLTIELRSIGGEEVPVVQDPETDVPADEALAVQNLAMSFVRAQYAGDLEALRDMGTERLRADLAAHPDDYLRAQGAEVVFAQMTDVALTEDGTYLLFVRLMDSAEWSESQYQENFEIRRVDGRWLVDFMGMDA
jgi:Predicted transmembrane transcriptional regulator (anti-sigma factor)